MKTTLSHVASLSTGMSFRARLEKKRDGNLGVVQMKDLDGAVVALESLDTIHAPLPKEELLIKSGDIVLRSRGLNTSAALIRTSEIDAVVMAPLFHIRAKKSVIEPEYLLWYLNRPATQNYLGTQLKGTTLKMLGKRELMELEILLPELNVQRRIVSIAGLMKREHELCESIMIKRAHLAQKFLENAIQ